MDKKIFISLLLLTIVNVVSFSQDLIITSSANRIEAQIIEISKENIKYKMWNNPQGPTFVLSSDEINTIIFANGMVKTYKATNDNKTIVLNNVVENKDIQNYDSEMLNMHIKRIKNDIEKSNDLISGGIGCLGGGAVLTIIGSAYYDVLGGRNMYNKEAKVGVAFMTIGAACMHASIPLLIVGHMKRNKIEAQFELSANSNESAVGLTLNF